MQPAGKATPTDARAYAYLLPQSSFAPASPTLSNAEAQVGAAQDRMDVSLTVPWNEQMQQAKNDVSQLDTQALLLRDLKITNVHTSQGSNMQVGLASVPLSLSAWISGAYRTRASQETVHDDVAEQEWHNWWKEIASFMRESRLDMAVILLSYRERKNDREHGGERMKSRRDLAMAFHGAPDILQRMASSLEQYGTQQLFPDGVHLQLDTWKGERRTSSGQRERVGGLEVSRQVRGMPGISGIVWRQRNTQANRKIVQPALQRVLQTAL